MTSRVTLICHGATTAVRTAAFPAHEPLHERAAAAATRLAGVLRRIDHALTSPALRARQTAAALSLDATEDAMLRDCDYGRWTGRRLSDVEEEEPDAVASWLTDAQAAPHGGESLAALHDRTAAWLGRRGRDGGHVVAVTHAAVIRAAIVHAIGAPLSSFWRIDITPLSLTDLRWNNGLWTLRAMGMPMGGGRKA
jgi:broad specificity phosphatase PhoE